MTIAEFLNARLTEDEALARGVDAEEWGGIDVWGEGKSDFYYLPAGGERWPARVLAECAAKRRVVELFEMVSAVGNTLHSDAWIVARQAALELAAVYSDHPDYREEWKP